VRIYTGDIRPVVDLHVIHSAWCGSTRETFGPLWIYTWDIRPVVDLHVRHSAWCGSTCLLDLLCRFIKRLRNCKHNLLLARDWQWRCFLKLCV